MPSVANRLTERDRRMRDASLAPADGRRDRAPSIARTSSTQAALVVRRGPASWDQCALWRARAGRARCAQCEQCAVSLCAAQHKTKSAAVACLASHRDNRDASLFSCLVVCTPPSPPLSLSHPVCHATMSAPPPRPPRDAGPPTASTAPPTPAAAAGKSAGRATGSDAIGVTTVGRTAVATPSSPLPAAPAPPPADSPASREAAEEERVKALYYVMQSVEVRGLVRARLF